MYWKVYHDVNMPWRSKDGMPCNPGCNTCNQKVKASRNKIWNHESFIIYNNYIVVTIGHDLHISSWFILSSHQLLTRHLPDILRIPRFGQTPASPCNWHSVLSIIHLHGPATQHMSIVKLIILIIITNELRYFHEDQRNGKTWYA